MVLAVGLWSSLPLDYLVKISGSSHVNSEMVDQFAAPFDHPAWPLLLQRTLRLNCLTKDFAPLWTALYHDDFGSDSWTPAFNELTNSLPVAASEWSMRTPLRTDFDRRSALVEIDALAGIMLGLSSDHLGVIYRAQFPVLRKYEYQMYFDAGGRKIAKDHQAYGVRQLKNDYNLLQRFIDGGDYADLLDRYDPFEPDGEHSEPWFYKADREAEMLTAYLDFEERFASRG